MSRSVQVETEVINFLAQLCIPRATGPVVWWSQNAARFTAMSIVAKRHLAAPLTSVPSERLFSTAGDVCLDKRSCLFAEKVERLVFLKANVPIN